MEYSDYNLEEIDEENDFQKQRDLISELLGEKKEQSHPESPAGSDDSKSLPSTELNINQLSSENQLILKDTQSSVNRTQDYISTVTGTVIDRCYQLSQDELRGLIRKIQGIIARLQEERQSFNEKLIDEKKRVVNLQKELDALVKRRLKQLPNLVQHEHESCVKDITELQWHVSFKTRQETRFKAKLDIAENLNDQLQDDIDKILETNPLIDNKLHLEQDSMSDIHSAQNLTQQELEKTMLIFNEAQKKSAEANKKASKERKYLAKEIEGVKSALHKGQTELNKAHVLENQYLAEIESAKQKLIDTENETLECIDRLTEIREIENNQKELVRGLEERHETLANQNRMYRQENMLATEQLKSVQTRLNHEKITLEAYITSNDRKCKESLAANRELRSEHNTLLERKNSNISNQAKDTKSIERAYKDIDKTENQIEKINVEYHQLDVVNQSLKKRIAEIEERTQKKEDLLMDQLDQLEHQVKDEIHKKIKLQNRITTENAEMGQLEIDLKKQRTKIDKKASEVQGVLTKVKSQVEKMRGKNEGRQKTLNELLSALRKLESIYQDTESKLSGQKNKLLPQMKTLQSKELQLSKQIDQLQWESEKTQTKIDEVRLNSVHLNRVTRITSNEIEDFTTNIANGRIKLQEDKDYLEVLKSTAARLSQKKKDYEADFVKHRAERKEFLSELQYRLSQCLDENARLAEVFSQLRERKFIIKNNLMTVAQQRNEVEMSKRSLHQVGYLQERFRRALKRYFKYRTKYFENELNDCRVIDLNNANIEAEIASRINTTIDDISVYLQRMGDGSLVREVQKAAAQAEQSDEEETKPFNKYMHGERYPRLPPIQSNTLEEEPMLQTLDSRIPLAAES